MEKGELLKIWTNKLFDELGIKTEEERYVKAFDAAWDILGKVYDVGFEAGKDTQKLEVQLSKLGKPHGIE